MEALLDWLGRARECSWAFDPGVRALFEELSSSGLGGETNLAALPPPRGRAPRTRRRWCARNTGMDATRLRIRFVVARSFEILVADPTISLEWLAVQVGYGQYSSLLRGGVIVVLSGVVVPGAISGTTRCRDCDHEEDQCPER